MQNQVADMTELLQKVLQSQTSKEKELQALINTKGGRDKVINDDSVLLELSVKYDERESGWDKERAAKDGGDKTLDVTLKAELETSIDEQATPLPRRSVHWFWYLNSLLLANETLFNKKFTAQTDMLIDAMDYSANKVIKALSQGPYERIEDPDMRTLWREEGWRSSVKARHFIIALHDYFSLGARPDSDLPEEDLAKLTVLKPSHPDSWTLEYSKRILWIVAYHNPWFSERVLYDIDPRYAYQLRKWSLLS